MAGPVGWFGWADVQQWALQLGKLEGDPGDSRGEAAQPRGERMLSQDFRHELDRGINGKY